MRIDIKSESELETQEQAAPAGASLAELRGMTPDALEILRGAGLESPDAIVAAGRERVAGLLAAPGQADEVFAAAEVSVASRPAPTAPAGEGTATPTTGAEAPATGAEGA
jgi:hypothetical protein